MPCKIEIKKTIEGSISTLTNDDYWGFTEKQARPIAVKLNSLWGSIASVQQSTGQGGYRIIISRLEEAVDREYTKQLGAEKQFQRTLDFFNDDTALYEQEQKEIKESGLNSLDSESLFGLNDDENLEFHINTINVVSKFLENAGVEQRLVPEFLSSDGSVVEGALAAANFINGTVDIIDDLNKRPSAWNKLPEEAAHWWYRLLDKNSALKEALLTASATSRKEEELRNSLYGDVYEGPKVIGQLALDENGNVTQRPALSAIREEAIGQLIAESIKRIEEKNGAPADYSFLKKFIEWINSIIDMFRSTEVDVFDVAAMKILSSDMTDLMTWEEYNTLNNKVYIDSIVSDQSVSPVDTSIISDLGTVEINTVFTTDLEKFPDGVVQTYRWIYTEKRINVDFELNDFIGDVEEVTEETFVPTDRTSPAFYTQEELNGWIVNNIPQYLMRQEKALQEVKDNEIFFDRLLNKTFKKRSKFLPKTLKKLYSVESVGVTGLPQFIPNLSNVELTKDLNPREKEILVNTNDYNNITPTLKVLPDVLKKYSKNPISLSEPLKIDTAKKQELAVINSVMGLIKEENPGKKSISAEDLVAEVSNYLKVNYLLGFASERKYESYRIDQTFTQVPDRMTDEDVDMTNINDDTLAQMPLEERQNLINLTGLTKKNPSVYHDKVSLRFNDRYFPNANSHFNYAPSAWGNLTYFYTGDKKFKDAVLLHEIQNDNIEMLRSFKPSTLSLDNQLDEFKKTLDEALHENIKIVGQGGLKLSKFNTNDSRSPLRKDYLSYYVGNLDLSVPTDELVEIDYPRLIEILQESIDLYEGNKMDDNLTRTDEQITNLYSTKRKLESFFRRGGYRSLLSDEDVQTVKNELDKVDRYFYSGAYTFDEVRMNFGSVPEIQKINEKINAFLKKEYDFLGSFYIVPFMNPRSRGGGINTSIKYFFYGNERKELERINKNIAEAKKQRLSYLKAKNGYIFKKNLIKITREQFAQIIDNYKYNVELLDRAVENQANIEYNLKTNGSSENLEKLRAEQETLYNQALQQAEATTKKLSKKYKDPEQEAKRVLDVEMNYFTPLVHHLIQKHIKEVGKLVPMYFSGHAVTLLTQGNRQTALIYAGKDEVPFTPEEVREIKKKAAQQLGLIPSESYEKEITEKDVTTALNGFKRQSSYDAQRVTSKILELSGNRPIETGALYNAMSQIPGIKLVWKDSIKGLKNNVGGYLVDLTNYNYNTPVLYGLENNKPSVKETKDALEQAEVSPKVISMLKDFLKRIGVDVKLADDIVVNGVKQNDKGIALLTQKLIQLTQGAGNSVAVEEAMHFAVEIIQQKDPALFNKLLKEINNYSVLKDVYAQYSKDKAYQTKDGKPNIIKLKKEAIGRVLAEVVLQNVEGSNMTLEAAAKVESWWKQIIDALKRIFLKSGFDQAAMDIISGKNIGTVEDIRAEEGDYYLHKTGDKQTDKYNALLSRAKRMAPPTEEGGKYTIDGNKKADMRVSDISKSFYERKAEAQELTKDEFTKAVDSIKQEDGTGGHADMDYIVKNVLVDQNGYLRGDNNEGDDSGYVSRLNPNNKGLYTSLKNNLRERLKSFGPNTRFLSEVMVYNPKRGNKSIAGTIDLIAIQKDGTVNLLDWKFMNLNTDKYDDIPWYKSISWKLQMDEYKDILVRGYGFEAQDFGQTRMIPIRTEYSASDRKRNIKPQLLGIQIGAVNVNDITDDYLIPVGIESESTGDVQIDKLLEKLNADYITLAEKPAKTETERKNKIEQLNSLFSAIRKLQMKKDVVPLIKQAKILNERIQDSIDRYYKSWVGTDAKSYTDVQLSDFSNELRDFRHTLDTYTSLDIALKVLFDDEEKLSEKDKELKSEISKTVNLARHLKVELEDVSEKFAVNFNYTREDISDGNLPEKIIKGAARMFSSTALLQSRSIQAFFHKENRALTKAAFDIEEESSKLQEKEKEYKKLAMSKGWTRKDYFDIIKKKDKNELIDEFDPKFYEELKSHIKDKDYTWIQENVDKEEYQKILNETLKEEFFRIETKPRGGLTEDEMNNEITLEKNTAILNHDISSGTGTGWLQYDLIKRVPLRSKWESDEFKKLNAKGNEAALDFYNYIIERNQEYERIGYIFKGGSRKFLPFARKGILEKIQTGGKVSIGEEFVRSITVDEGDIGFGKIDKHTGEIVNSIPRYFTKDLDGELSDDLFKLMTLYNEMAIKFKYLQEIEGQVLSLIDLERNKEAINTSFFGTTVYKNGRLEYIKDNSKNSKLLENMANSILYGQKYVQDENFDILLGTVGNWGKNINEAIGLKIFPENLAGRQISGNKVISTLNQFMQRKTLALSLLAPTSNLFGGTYQSVINAGTYFTKTDYAASELWLNSKMMGGVSEADRRKFIGALQYFLPLTENYNAEVAKKLSLNGLSQEKIQDFLFFLMRNSDKHVQTVNFRSFITNSVVIDGEVVNAREYLRSTSEYENMYEGTEKERKAKRDKFETDVKKLVSEFGVLKLGEIVDNKFVIPGVERKSDNVIKVRTKIQQLSVDALGNMTETQRRMLNMTIYGDSFSLFKNWIPRLADVRFGGMKYNAASDRYEWGRLRTVFSELSPNVFKTLRVLRSSLLATDEGVTHMRQAYEKMKETYERDTDKKFRMTESQFMDMYRANVRNSMYDAIAILSILGIILALKANAPDDNEDETVRNQYKFMLRAVDKLRDELTYFYDPSSFAQLISSGMFPSVQLITNFEKIFENFLKYNWGILIGDDGKVKDAHTFKYVMKQFPITNQMQQYLPLFFPDLAKDMGIRVQSTSGFIR